MEKNINLKIAITLSQLLEQSGFDVIMTRNADTSTETHSAEKIPTRKKSDLKNRLKLMNDNPDSVFVSIHLNKFTTSSACGSQIFYSCNDKSSKILADGIQKSITEKLQPDNTRVNKQANSGTFLLYRATVPAVLVECGFLSNSAELQKLKDENYQKQMAFAVYCGIIEFFAKNN